jgi:hypothetical protein
MYKACWALWVGGTALILLSWVNVVPTAVGWVGFGAAAAGTLLSFAAQNAPRGPRQSPGEGGPNDTSG